MFLSDCVFDVFLFFTLPWAYNKDDDDDDDYPTVLRTPSPIDHTHSTLLV